MDVWAATEEAYKNGYAKGYKDAIGKFSEEIKEAMWQMSYDEDIYVPYPFTFVDKVAYMLEEEINKKRERSA